MIYVPIDIGDIILTGKFKNKKVVVREIGTDDNGLPTVNGKGILKIRVQKLMPKKEERLRRILGKLIKEELLRLQEREVEDPKIAEAIDQLAEIERKLSEANAAMAALKKQLGIAELEKQAKQIVDGQLWDFLEELRRDEARVARTKKVIMDVKRYQTEKLTYKYESVLDFAMTQVNQAVKEKILMELKATESLSRQKPSLAFTPRQEGKLNEGIGDFVRKIGSFLKTFLSKIQVKGQKIDGNIRKLEQMARS